MLIIVVMKLIAPRIDDTPARCREKIVRSTEAPAWAKFPAKGGYTVHPVPAPASTIEDASSNRKDGGSSQKLMLFIRGKAISGAPIISGTSQLPKPPIIMGITIKKISAELRLCRYPLTNIYTHRPRNNHFKLTLNNPTDRRTLS